MTIGSQNTPAKEYPDRDRYSIRNFTQAPLGQGGELFVTLGHPVEPMGPHGELYTSAAGRLAWYELRERDRRDEVQNRGIDRGWISTTILWDGGPTSGCDLAKFAEMEPKLPCKERGAEKWVLIEDLEAICGRAVRSGRTIDAAGLITWIEQNDAGGKSQIQFKAERRAMRGRR
jgi:hypothetical protein